MSRLTLTLSSRGLFPGTQADINANQQTDRQTDRQTGRQADRQMKTDRYDCGNCGRLSWIGADIFGIKP